MEKIEKLSKKDIEQVYGGKDDRKKKEANRKEKPDQFEICPQCGAQKLVHRVCPNCGYSVEDKYNEV